MEAMRHFIVLGRARVGSNLLISLLRQHPHVSARGEELAGKKDNLDEAIANVFRPNRPQAKASGVKLFYYHPAPYERALESVEWCEAWERAWSVVGQISGLHVIHLVRENPLRSLVSQKIAIVTGVWQVTPEKGSLLPLGQRKVAVDAGKFIRYVRDTEAWRHDFDRRFPERNLRVTYEDLVARPQEVMDGIFGFLGLETVVRVEKHNLLPPRIKAGKILGSVRQVAAVLV